MTLLGEQKGSSSIEFAIVGSVFISLLVAMLSAGYSLYLQTALDDATQRAARQIMTGIVQNTKYGGATVTADTFRTQVLCPLLPSPAFNCNDVFVNIQTFDEAVKPSGFYSFVNQAESGLTPPTLNHTGASFSPGNGSSYVYIQVAYPINIISALFTYGTKTTFNGKTVSVLMSSAAFRNEPFTTSDL